MPSQIAPLHTRWTHSKNVPLVNIFGPLHQFLVSPNEVSGAFGFMRAVLPPSIAIPLHSHPDPEVFCILDGALEFLRGDDAPSRWLIERTDDTVCIPGDVKHALRNPSLTSVTLLLITTPRIYNFFYELGKPFHPGQPTEPPVPEDMQQLQRLAAKYNYGSRPPKKTRRSGFLVFERVEDYGQCSQ